MMEILVACFIIFIMIAWTCLIIEKIEDEWFEEAE